MAGWICSAEMSPLICMRIPPFFPNAHCLLRAMGLLWRGEFKRVLSNWCKNIASLIHLPIFQNNYVISIYLLSIVLSIHLYVCLSNSLCTHSSIYKNMYIYISIHPSLNFKSFEFYLFKFEFLNFETKPFWMLHIPGIQATIWPWLLLHCQWIHCHGQCEATASFTVKFKANSAQSSGTWPNTTLKYENMFIMLQ